MTDYLTAWTIFDHPLDFPDHFVAREFVILPGEVRATGNFIQSSSLVTVREQMLMLGKDAWIERDPDDDPVVVETWM